MSSRPPELFIGACDVKVGDWLTGDFRYYRVTEFLPAENPEELIIYTKHGRTGPLQGSRLVLTLPVNQMISIVRPEGEDANVEALVQTVKDFVGKDWPAVLAQLKEEK